MSRNALPPLFASATTLLVARELRQDASAFDISVTQEGKNSRLSSALKTHSVDGMNVLHRLSTLISKTHLLPPASFSPSYPEDNVNDYEQAG